MIWKLFLQSFVGVSNTTWLLFMNHVKYFSSSSTIITISSKSSMIQSFFNF